MLGWPEKKLGFGLMRLPQLADGSYDDAQIAEMADAFLANGYTYFDTAYVYGGSEEAFRRAVVERHPRESFTIASKLAAWEFKDGFDAEAMFSKSMSRMGVDYIDFYMLHALQESHGSLYEDNGCWDFVKEKKEQGKIRYLGFSFHGSPALLEKLLTEHPEVDFVQLQINYCDWDDEGIASGKNYKIAVAHGVQVIVMEPVKGGILANLRPDVRKVFDDLDEKASSASYALRFTASLPGVAVVLSGMSNREQMAENLALFNDFKPLSAREEAVVREAGRLIHEGPTIPCTSCHYCMDGCPMGIQIPKIFEAYNLVLTYGDHWRPHHMYKEALEAGSGRASDCIECGQCETVCPQHIGIIEELKKASAILDKAE